jgi:hypothetical protein
VATRAAERADRHLADPADQIVQRQLGRVDLDLGRGVDLAQRARVGERRIETAQLVDQPELLGLRAGPHPALGDGLDLGGGLAAPGGDAADEHLVRGLHHGLHGELLVGGPRLEAGEHGGALAAAHRVGGDAELGERGPRRELAADHADRAGEGVGLGVDLGRAGGDVVAARRGDVAHRHHDRLLGLDLGDRVPDQLGGQRAAAAGVDAQHHRLDAIVGGEHAQGRHQRARRDLLARAEDAVAIAVDDVAERVHQRDVIRGGPRRRHRAEELRQLHHALGVVGLGLDGDAGPRLTEAIAERLEGRDLVDEAGLERARGREQPLVDAGLDRDGRRARAAPRPPSRPWSRSADRGSRPAPPPSPSTAARA